MNGPRKQTDGGKNNNREIGTGIARLVIFINQTSGKTFLYHLCSPPSFTYQPAPAHKYLTAQTTAKKTTDWVQVADGNGLLTTLMIWSMIEIGIAVVAGCLPTIWPLVSKIPIENMMRTFKSVLSPESVRSRASTRQGSSLHSGEKDSSRLTEKQINPEESQQRQGSGQGGEQNAAAAALPTSGTTGVGGKDRSGNNSASGGGDIV